MSVEATSSPTAENTEDLVLGPLTCANIALYMHEQYQKCPRQKYSYLGFPDWLQRIISEEEAKK